MLLSKKYSIFTYYILTKTNGVKMKKSILLLLIGLFVFQITKAEEPRLILVEQITTSSDNSPALYPIAQQYNNIVNSHSDVLPLTIHTNFNPDLFYEQRMDLANRILFYKKNNEQYPIPSFYVNGKEVLEINNLNSAIINEQKKVSPIKLKVKTSKESNNFVFVDVKLDADTTFNPEDLLFCAIIEGHINAPSVGNSNESDFYYVTRRIGLQPRIGEKINLNDENFMGVRFSFNKEDFWNMDEIYAIAWVQNNISKEALQIEKEKEYNEKPQIVNNKDTVEFTDETKNQSLFLELYNDSMGNLTINDLALESDEDFEVLHNADDMLLLPGTTKLITVKLKNKSVGSYSTVLTINSDSETNSELTIPIIANIESSSSPVITSDLETVDFGDVSKQKTETLTITNTGTGQLVIDDISFEGNQGGEFKLLNNFIPNIEPKESFDLHLNFKPKEEIAYFSTLVIKSNASNESQFNISLKGAGAELEQFASILLDIDSLDFGKTNFTTPMVKSVVINNTGNQPLEVKNSGIEKNSGSAFNFVGEKNITIAPETSDSLVIEFLPEENQEYTADLIIRSDDTNPSRRRISVPLRGLGDGVSNVKQLMSGIDIRYLNNELIFENKNELLNNVSIAINDISGAVVLEKEIDAAQNNFSVKTNNLSNNQVYLFRLYSNGKLVSSGKFINN